MRSLVIPLLLALFMNLVLQSSADILCHNFIHRRLENKVVNFEHSRRQNASVTVVLSKHAKTVEECKNACCGQILNKCNIISYNRDGIKSNCHLFYCDPLELCAFVDSSRMDLWILDSTNKSNHLQDPGGQNDGVTTTETYSKTFTPENGANTTGSLNDILKSIMEDPKTTKLPTVVPRKGVSLPNDTVAESKPLAKSSVKPRKGVSLPLDLNGIEKNSSLLLALDEAFITSTTELPLISYTLNNSGDSNHTTPMIEPSSGFTETTLNRNASDMTSALLYSSNASTPTVTSSASYSSAVNTQSTLPKSDTSYTTSSQLIRNSTFEDSSSLVNTTITSNKSVSTTTDDQVTATLTNSTTDRVDTTVSSDSQVISNATTKVLSTVFPTSYDTIIDTATTVSSKTKNNESDVTISKQMESPSTLPDNLGMTEDEEDESALESKSTAQIHLVIALTLGLVILIAVLLVTARRMFDRWQRRHYRRMDYLIDGMYHN